MVVLVLLVVLFAGGAPPIAVPACWWPPVAGVVVEAFREPQCVWCPGHRGIEFATVPGSTIRAVETGIVTFSGVVAGVRYVVVRHADGRRVTYGQVAATDLSTGDVAHAGSAVAVAGERFHFGVRAGARYLDPAPLLGEPTGRIRLVPVDGRPPRPAPPRELRCASSRTARG